jgi:hypothetical protein
MPYPTHKLADITEIRPGYLTREAVKHDPAGTHRILQIRDFSPDRTSANLTEMISIAPESHSSIRPLQTGDVLFLAKGANNFAFAVPALPAPTLAAAYFFVLRCTPATLPAYLAWFLNHDSTRAVLTRLSTKGAHMPIIRRDILESLDIPLPPVTIQQTIVNLDACRQEEQALLTDLARKQRERIAFITMSTARGAHS